VNELGGTVDDSLAGLLSLGGRTALVTGAATGIGEAIAKVLAQAGARVVIVDVDDDGAHRVAGECGGTWHHLDVTDPHACEATIGEIARTSGLDILVNNAGSYHESGSILDQSLESWRRSIEINLASVFNCSKPAAIHLVAQGRGGSIINISSVDGLLPCLGTGYDTAKAGVIHFTRSLAVDLAPHNIRVNGIAPGAVPVPTLTKSTPSPV
jgi:NAD(P)-dependent dehydrogenase (short-subunit alcohol dehydrogenase family)